MGFINERKNILRAEDGPLVSVDKDGNVVNDFSGGGADLSIPSGAKMYFPDIEGIFDDIFYILENEPISATDSVFLNFVDARVVDLATLDVDAAAFLNKGIYESADFEEFGTYVRNIGYSGVTNTGAFNGPTATPDYSGANYYFIASFDGNGYDEIDSFCDLSVKGDVEVSYQYDKTEGDDAIETQIWIQNIPSRNIAISLNVVVDNTVIPRVGTYSIQVVGQAN